MIALSAIFLALRAAQLVFALIVLGVSGQVSRTWSPGSAPPEMVWLVICSIIAWFSVFYLELAPKFIPSISHPYASIVLETTNTMFLFAGGVAVAAFLAALPSTTSSTCPFMATAQHKEWTHACINIAACAAAAAMAIIAAILWGVSAFLTIKDMFRLKHPRIDLSRKLSIFSTRSHDGAVPKQTV